MILLNPKKHDREYLDQKSREIMRKTIAFFEGKGDMGEFEDVTEEYGVMDAESKRDRERVAVAYAEAVISRDRVEASQRLRELVQTG